MSSNMSRRALILVSGAVLMSVPVLAHGDVSFLGSFGSFGTAPGQLGGALGATVDSAGNVFVAEAISSRVQEFTANGSFLQTIGAAGSGTASLSRPFGV